MNEGMKLKLKVKCRLKKYAVGADPLTAEPFEVKEMEDILIGDEAHEFLHSLTNTPQNGGFNECH